MSVSGAILTRRSPPTKIPFPADDDASVNIAIGKAIAENGRIDVLVNNAGVGGGGSVEEVPVATFRAVMETIFFGALRCINLFATFGR
jgi:NAD(P)-dependent dehydrogenase (short-subunit alcohol dehydrogenase family)